MTTTDTRAWLVRALAQAQKDSIRASEARAALPPGTSRTRVTSANAKWARAPEERDRLQKRLEDIPDDDP